MTQSNVPVTHHNVTTPSLRCQSNIVENLQSVSDFPKQTSDRAQWQRIPAELRDRAQWVVWRYEQRGDKRTKVPYSPSGKHAKSSDPTTWATFEQVIAVAERFDGIGYVFSADDPYTGCDFDAPLDAGKLATVKTLGSYTERSPSGNGLHVIVRAKLRGPGHNDQEAGREIYDRGRYFTMTGAHVEGTPTSIEARQSEIDAYYTQFEDNALLKRMFASKGGASIKALWNGDLSAHGGDASAADLALCNHLAFWANKDAQRIDRLFRQSRLYREKWDRNARTGETYGQGTIKRAIDATDAPIFHTNGSTPAVHTNGSAANGATAPLANVGATNGAAAFDFSGFQTDAGNAQRFAAQHAGALRYTQAHGWLHWDGKRWKADETGEVFRLARRTVAAMMRDAQSANEGATRAMEAIAKRIEAGEDAEDATPAIKAAQKRANELQKWAVKSQSKERLKAMVELAQSEPGIAAHAADFDRDPWLLNCQNGILNLKTGKLSPHDPGAMMTQLAGANFDAGAKCPTWLTFLERVQPDPEMHPFLQRSTGYALTGNTSEQRYWNKIGRGANGKSVYTSTVMALLGSYAIRLRAATFMQQRNQSGASATPDIARIEGKRLVLTDEIPDSQVLDEGLVKSITGEDRIAARKLYQDGYEFTSQAKLWFVGNHRPVIKDVGYSIWRRVLLVDFPVTIPEGERDPALTDKLLAELDGILAWAVQGCSDWQRSGLAIPQAVIDATNEYRTDSDLVGQWLAERTVKAPIDTSAERLFKDYSQWCESSGLRPMTKLNLGRNLNDREMASKKTNKGMVYLNIALVADDEK